MSWYRQVKTIYTATYLVFIFICCSLLGNVFLGQKIDFKTYIVMISSVFAMQYLSNKEKQRVLVIALPCVLAAVTSYLIYPIEPFLLNTAVNIIMILFLEKQDSEDVNYDAYKDRMKTAILILVGIGLVMPIVNKSTIYWIFRFYIMFLVFVIVTLREARNYCNKIRNKKSTIANSSIIVAGIVMSTDFMSSVIIKIFHYLMLPINYVINKLAMAMFFILYKPLVWIFKGIKALLRYFFGEGKEVKLNEVNSAAQQVLLDEKLQGTPLAAKIMAVIILLCIVVLIIKLYIKLNRSMMKRSKLEADELQKEKIIHEGKKKKGNAFANLFNTLFRKEGSVKEQIMYIYSRFQLRMKLKEIFRPYMTATQLSNVAKINIDEYEALDSIKSIYNEAKFSQHNIPRENAVEMKTQYEKIKKSK